MTVEGTDRPTLGVSYHDATGRRLAVLHVDVGEKLGREVRGVICIPPCGEVEGEMHGVHPDYSCSLATWDALWQRRVPAWEGTG